MLIKYRLISFILCIVLFCIEGQAKGVYSPKDIDIYNEYSQWIEPYKGYSSGELLIKTASFFLGKPYVANTLDRNSKEELIINLSEFDCTTFVETCLALTLNTRSAAPSFERFCDSLKKIRYRKSEIENYTSRLHYMTDWIYSNSKKGLVVDVSEESGGRFVEKHIDFMSTHANLYPVLKNNPILTAKMRKVEDAINKRIGYYVLNAPDIEVNIQKIKEGDIILFNSKRKDLDYVHLGIACTIDGEMHFIHASSAKKKVVEEEKTISEYVSSSKTSNGISIVRLNKSAK